MFKRIDHIEFIPKDIQASLHFYTKQLGFFVVSKNALASPVFSLSIMIQHADIKLELLQAKEPLTNKPQEECYGIRLAAWEVDDIHTTLSQLQDRGVRASWGPKQLSDSIRAEIQDLDGNRIELRQWLS